MDEEGEVQDLGVDASGLPPMENEVELMKLILEPKTDDETRHVTKDLAISNLNQGEIWYINNNLKLIHLLRYIEGQTGWILNDLKRKVVNADIKGFMQVTRSKDGFERKAESQKRIKSTQTVRDERNKGFFDW